MVDRLLERELVLPEGARIEQRGEMYTFNEYLPTLIMIVLLALFLVYAVAILVSRPWSGKMYDMHGPAVIMYPAFVCLVLGLVLLWANLGGWAVLLSGVFAGLGFGNFTSVGQVSAISMVPRERYAQATSTFYVFFDLGIGVAPYLGGLILPAVGYTGIFGLNAVVVVLCIGGYWLLQRAGLTHRPTATGEAVRVHD